MIRLLPDGSIDQEFLQNPGELTYEDAANYSAGFATVKALPDGKIVAAGRVVPDV